MSKNESDTTVYDDTEIHNTMNKLGEELDKIIEDTVKEILEEK